MLFECEKVAFKCAFQDARKTNLCKVISKLKLQSLSM